MGWSQSLFGRLGGVGVVSKFPPYKLPFLASTRAGGGEGVSKSIFAGLWGGSLLQPNYIKNNRSIMRFILREREFENHNFIFGIL